jgi:PAS domain S-box-containing protein
VVAAPASSSPTPDLPEACHSLMERSPVPMAELEGAGHIVRYVNPAFCRLSGKSKEALVGHPFAETVQEGDTCMGAFDRVYRTGEAETHTETERADPHPPYWSYAVWPVLGRDEHTVGVMMQVTETTGFHQQAGAMNEALLLSSVRQHALTEASEKLNQQLQAEIGERKAANLALGESEEKYRTLFESIDEGFCIIEKVEGEPGEPIDFRYIAANPAFAVQSGVGDVVGKTIREAFPGERQEWFDTYAAVLTTGKAVRFERDLVTQGRILELYAVRVEDETRRRLAVVFADVTKRKRHEARQTMLLHELNHRVKNTLAMVQSIAMQTLRGSRDPEQARQQFDGRLMALAKAHDILTQESWSGALLARVVEEAIAPYRAPGSDRFDIEGPNIWVPPKYALALSMALHELCTNAVKYGALSNDSGRVLIAWTADNAGEARELRMRWIELGGPPVTPPQRRGFGSRLVERGLKQDLGGDVRLDFAATGVVCTIEAPLNGIPDDVSALGARETGDGVR